MTSTVRTVGEHHEIAAGDDVLNSPRYNKDIAPTTASVRTWKTWNFAALWVGMSICVPTYTLGGVLTAYFGLSVGEALWAIFLANVIILIPLCLNAHPGTKYGIPFPVLLRSSFGVLGSNVPALIRALVACGWFGIQTLFGGLAIHFFLSAIFPSWEQLGGAGEVYGFAIFWVLNVWVVIRGSEAIKNLEAFAAPLLLIVGMGLLVWAYPQASVTDLLAQAPNRPADASLWGYFFGGLTAMVGFWATLALNIPDFSRYAESQRAQVRGQIIGLPVTMFLFAALGVVLTAASPTLVGETVSDPITLIGKIDSPVWGLLGPVAGIMIVDYFIVRRRELDLPGLYKDGVYPAWNTAGFTAFLVPVALTFVALFVEQLGWFYSYGWFTGSLLGAVLYWVMSMFGAHKNTAAAAPAAAA